MCNYIDMDRAITIITEALIAYGYSRMESEVIISKFLEEEAKNYLDSLKDQDKE